MTLRQLIDDRIFIARELPGAFRGGLVPTLGDCPACGRRVAPDRHALRLQGSFFHTRCALYQRRG